jgi:TonB-dependent receptor
MSGRYSSVFLALAFCFASAAASAQTSTGTIEGRVLDSLTGEPLPGATVVLEGSSLVVSTDRTGIFRLSGAPIGDQTLVVAYLGSADARVAIAVKTGTVTSAADVRLDKVAYSETVVVTADVIRGAQARALNQQKTASNITNVVSADQIGSFPDPNAAETMQRIPGVSISKDQGEGRYVLVRGAEARLNSMMIDGERIPSPDPNLRQVALDVVPSDLLQSIEVSKAILPDQDGDAIGGGVNLVMKQAPEKLRLFGNVGTGYNSLLESYEQNSYGFTGGRRFKGGKVGAILSVSGSGTLRGNQDVEVVYSAGTLLDLDPRYYQVQRDRVGVTGALDFRQGANSSYTLRGVFNRYVDDHENRQRFRNRVGNRRLERELRDRTHIEHIDSLTFSGSHLTPWAAIDYRVLGAYSDQTDPLTMTTTFRQSNVNFAPNVTPDSIDPDNVQANPLNQDVTAYTFNSQIRAANSAKDRDIVGAANIRKALATSGSVASFLKFGGKYRDKAKSRTRDEVTITTSSRLVMTDYLDSGMDLPPFLDDRYDLSPYLSQSKVEQIPTQVPVVSTPNRARDAEEFDGTERTAAGYAMAEIYAGSKLLLLPGVRYEYTASDYTGYRVLFSPTGAYLSTSPVQSKTNYGVALPAFHLKYAATPETNVRVALTRSFARPNYYDLVPYEARNDVDNTVTLGNTDLNPTTSWNVDVLGEHYFKSVGVVSGGFFYKRLKDYIYVYTYDQPINGTIYHYTQPLNGDAATIRGVEVALQNQLSFLPSPLDGLGVYANYTLSDSTASFPQHNGDSTLPGQSKHIGNLALSYEKRGFQGRVAMTFHGSYVDVVGATNQEDRYYDTANQLDLSAIQRITRNIRVYVNGLNANDALLRYYQGTKNRVLQEEHYHWWMDFGVKFDF